MWRQWEMRCIYWSSAQAQPSISEAVSQVLPGWLLYWSSLLTDPPPRSPVGCPPFLSLPTHSHTFSVSPAPFLSISPSLSPPPLLTHTLSVSLLLSSSVQTLWVCGVCVVCVAVRLKEGGGRSVWSYARELEDYWRPCLVSHRILPLWWSAACMFKLPYARCVRVSIEW